MDPVGESVGGVVADDDGRPALAYFAARGLVKGYPDYVTTIHRRGRGGGLAFAESAASGLTVFELDPDMLASQEMNQLVDEAEALLGLTGAERKRA